MLFPIGYSLLAMGYSLWGIPRAGARILGPGPAGACRTALARPGASSADARWSGP